MAFVAKVSKHQFARHLLSISNSRSWLSLPRPFPDFVSVVRMAPEQLTTEPSRLMFESLAFEDNQGRMRQMKNERQSMEMATFKVQPSLLAKLQPHEARSTSAFSAYCPAARPPAIQHAGLRQSHSDTPPHLEAMLPRIIRWLENATPSSIQPSIAASEHGHNLIISALTEPSLETTSCAIVATELSFESFSTVDFGSYTFQPDPS